VVALLEKAAAAGVEASLVRIDNFDEIMSDLVRQVGTFDTTQLEALGQERRRFSRRRCRRAIAAGRSYVSTRSR
jgi:hypothetical protein